MGIEKEQYRSPPTAEALTQICKRWDDAVATAPIWGGQHPWESIYAHALLALHTAARKLDDELARLPTTTLEKMPAVVEAALALRHLREGTS